ncbi:putative Esterase precursor [Hibiscus syriacus]|uniref:Esterase n=2 Tax=Hibiscus syriacus TaxID=106335 RepID=A0A6A2WVN6_HIBSY|nr:putative Esterase precursor [Hibiscus syriacus]
MNGFREEDSRCYFHPKEVVMGVCALCLNERLLILASKQAQRSSSSSTKGSHRFIQGVSLKKPPINLPKIFALGSLLNRLEFNHCKSEHSDAHDSSTSQEDSFISIKFEENGVGSWEKGTISKVSLEHCNVSRNPTLTKGMDVTKETNKSVIEHSKPRASLRWRKRIGHLFQLIRWKRSSKANACHMGNKVDGVKVMRRKGWMRTLTKWTKE